VSFIEPQAQRPKTVININVLSLREDAGLVGGELGAEGIDGIETALVTNLAVEGNFEVEAVDILVENEDIGLDGALATGTDGRTDTDVALAYRPLDGHFQGKVIFSFGYYIVVD